MALTRAVSEYTGSLSLGIGKWPDQREIYYLPPTSGFEKSGTDSGWLTPIPDRSIEVRRICRDSFSVSSCFGFEYPYLFVVIAEQSVPG